MYTRFYVILLCSLFLLLGCTAPSTSVTEAQEAQIDVKELTISPETKLLGTLSNGLLLFANYEATIQSLFSYNLETGEQHVMYTPTHPMRNVIMHPSGNTLLIVGAKSPTVAHIELYTADMEKLYETDVVSHDIYATFDAANEQQFSITAFTENYEATVYTYSDYTWQTANVSHPFVRMRDGSLYTFIDGELVANTQTMTEHAAHILIAQSDVYYVEADDATVVHTSAGTIQFLHPIVSLHEQFGDVYAWIQDGAHYQLIQLQDMTPLLTTEAPVPFFMDADHRFIIYGDQYEWLQQKQQQPMQWLSIN